jgi:hypothetical protein
VIASKDEKLLDQLCGKIEAAFPGIYARYKDFVQPRPQVEDGYNTIELFCVPDAKHTQILDACYEMAEAMEDGLSLPVLFMPWSEHESTTYFAADLQHIRGERLGGWKQVFPDDCLAVDLICQEVDDRLSVPVMLLAKASPMSQGVGFEAQVPPSCKLAQAEAWGKDLVWVFASEYEGRVSKGEDDADASLEKAA